MTAYIVKTKAENPNAKYCGGMVEYTLWLVTKALQSLSHIYPTFLKITAIKNKKLSHYTPVFLPWDWFIFHVVSRFAMP